MYRDRFSRRDRPNRGRGSTPEGDLRRGCCCSRRITEREKFQKKLEETCRYINFSYTGDIYAGLKILKGIDEIGSVLSTMSKSYEIINILLDHLHPNLMRFVLVFDYIDTALGTMDIAKMDGPAFHKASNLMSTLKKSKLTFDMSVGDKVIDTAITGQITLILLLKKSWSAKQHQIVKEYEKTKNQYEVAKNLGISKPCQKLLTVQCGKR